ncbi:hypothetical protein M378DRAFT_549051 [Amanita muscaria Koide BX008]|uniref:Secreted protein n=1 Tax=Amanita muscaria (strain Koide BX008) TaxID=946122 RepID=A0A0C2SPV1_AMAMK|nr:hypothetical protein M378DRAFT_549051 [Amanita muscaria Koide BX008]
MRLLRASLGALLNGATVAVTVLHTSRSSPRLHNLDFFMDIQVLKKNTIALSPYESPCRSVRSDPAVKEVLREAIRPQSEWWSN